MDLSFMLDGSAEDCTGKSQQVKNISNKYLFVYVSA